MSVPRTRPFWAPHPAPDGSRGEMCYRTRTRRNRRGKVISPCPEGWHHHGPYLPIGQLGDEWFWKEPKS